MRPVRDACFFAALRAEADHRMSRSIFCSILFALNENDFVAAVLTSIRRLFETLSSAARFIPCPCPVQGRELTFESRLMTEPLPLAYLLLTQIRKLIHFPAGGARDQSRGAHIRIDMSLLMRLKLELTDQQLVMPVDLSMGFQVVMARLCNLRI